MQHQMNFNALTGEQAAQLQALLAVMATPPQQGKAHAQEPLAYHRTVRRSGKREITPRLRQTALRLTEMGVKVADLITLSAIPEGTIYRVLRDARLERDAQLQA